MEESNQKKPSVADRKNSILRQKRINPNDLKNEERLKELQMMKKDDMSLGQLFEFCRIWPEDLDGFIFEQKINQTISEEFIRIQGKVDHAFSNVQQFYTKMAEFDAKVDICRAQMSRIGKFDGAIESFNRQNLVIHEQMASLSNKVLDNQSNAVIRFEKIDRKLGQLQTSTQSISKIIESPKDLTSGLQSYIEDMENRWGEKQLQEELRLQEFILSHDQTAEKMTHQISELQSKYVNLQEPLKQHDVDIAKYKQFSQLIKTVVEEQIWHLQALKKQSLMTNLHLEAYLPFQVASMASDVVKSLVKKKKIKRDFRKNFSKIISELEQNMLNCCNPEKFGSNESQFRQLTYKLPDDYLNPLKGAGSQDEVSPEQLEYKLAKFAKLEQQRIQAREQSLQNAYNILEIEDRTGLQAVMVEPILGFNIAADHVFKIDKFKRDSNQFAENAIRDQTFNSYENKNLKKEDEQRVSDDENEGKQKMNISKRISFQMMKEKIDIRNQMQAQFDECIKMLDARIIKFDKIQRSVEEQRALQYQEFRVELDFFRTTCSKTVDRVKQHETLTDTQIITFQNTIVQKIDEKMKSLEMVHEMLQGELEAKVKKHVDVQMAQHNAQLKVMKQQTLASSNRQYSQPPISQKTQQKQEEVEKKVKFNKKKEKESSQSKSQSLSSESQQSSSNSSERERKKSPVKKLQKKILEAAGQSSKSLKIEKIVSAPTTTVGNATISNTSSPNVSKKKSAMVLPMKQLDEAAISVKSQVKQSTASLKIQTTLATPVKENVSLRSINVSDKISAKGLQASTDLIDVAKNSNAKQNVSINRDSEQKIKSQRASQMTFDQSNTAPVAAQDNSTPIEHNQVYDSENDQADEEVKKQSFKSIPTQVKEDSRELECSKSIQDENQIQKQQVTSTPNTISIPAVQNQQTALLQQKSKQKIIQETLKLQEKPKEKKPSTVTLNEVDPEEVLKQNYEKLALQILQVESPKHNGLIEIRKRQEESKLILSEMVSKIKNTALDQNQQVRQPETKQSTSKSLPKKNSQKLKKEKEALVKEQPQNLQIIDKIKELKTKESQSSPSENSDQISSSQKSKVKAKSSKDKLDDSDEDISDESVSESEDEEDEEDENEGDSSSDSNGEGDPELASLKYCKKADFEKFKKDLSEHLSQKFMQRDEIMLKLQQDSFLFFEENTKFLQIIGEQESKVMQQCIKLNTEAVTKFEGLFQIFKSIIQRDVKFWRQRHNEMELQNAKQTNQFNSLVQIIEILKNNAANLDQIMRNQWQSLEFYMDQQINLNRQEDIDKQSLSLIGIREKEQQAAASNKVLQSTQSSFISTSQLVQQQAVLSIDPRCLNCDTDQSQKTILFQKFKLACLSYKPSPVLLESGLKYPRQELFDMQQQILDQIKLNRQKQKEQIQPRKIIDRLLEENFFDRNQVQSPDLPQDRMATVQLYTSSGDQLQTEQYYQQHKEHLPQIKLANMISESQFAEAKRINKLRVGLRSQPTGNVPRQRHKIVVLDHQKYITTSPKYSVAGEVSQLSDHMEDVFALPQLSSRQIQPHQDFIFSFKDKFAQKQSQAIQEKDKLEEKVLQTSLQSSRSHWANEQTSLLQSTNNRRKSTIGDKIKRTTTNLQSEVPELEVRSMNLASKIKVKYPNPVK